MKDRQVVWPDNCVEYLKNAIDNFDNSLGVYKTELNNCGDVNRSYSSSFKPALDVTEEMGEELTKSYQKLIGFMRWSIEIGRIAILK